LEYKKHPPEVSAVAVAIFAMIGAIETISGGSLIPRNTAKADKPVGSEKEALTLTNVEMMPMDIEMSSTRLAIFLWVCSNISFMDFLSNYIS
jgi:hypothetical protein